jgi:predicted nucleotidyltransferase
VTEVSSRLATTALDPVERRVLDHFVAAVEAEYGEELHGVWLYGSRARGERAHQESDIDVLVVTRQPRDDLALYRLADEARDAVGGRRVIIDPRQRTVAWVEDRRAIDSFFLQEVDRDKVVLVGDP